MWQRPHDHYHALTDTARARVAELLADVPGAVDALQRPISQRVARRDNRVVLEAIS